MPHARAMHQKAQRHWPSRAEGSWSPRSTGFSERLVAKKTPTTSAPGTRNDVAEGSHNHEADESRSSSLGVVLAVASLLALGVDVHPSGRLCLSKGRTPRQTRASCRLLRLVGKSQLPTHDDAVEEHKGATEHSAAGHLCRHASTANHGGMRLYHGSSPHVGRTRDHKTTLCELLSEARVISRIFARAPEIPRQVDQIGLRKSPGEKTRVAEHGSEEQGTAGHQGPGKQGVRWSRCIWR